MIRKFYNFISPGIFPFTICILLIVFTIFYKLFNLPSSNELFVKIQSWYSEYGLPLLFLAALIEGLFIIGMYFPGSLAIALAVYSLGDNLLSLFYIGAISFIAFLIANICDYYLGKYGYYKFLLLIGKKNIIEDMNNTMIKYGNRTFFITGFFPNFIAITSVCAGISNMPIRRAILLQAASLLFWVTIWTITGSFIVKKINLQSENQSYFILGIVFCWGVYLVIRKHYKIKATRSTIIQ